MTGPRYLTAKEAADRLGVSLPTLYAYVSRGLIRSQSAGDGGRQRRYSAEDVERLIARKEGRKNPEKLARDALHWGAPVLDSALTLIDDGQLYYRGHDAITLATRLSVEEVAGLLWLNTPTADLFRDRATDPKTHYETMLLHMEMDGADLKPLAAMQVVLPIAGVDDLTAYDLRPEAVARTGARILRLMASVTAGEVPNDTPLAQMLQQGLCPDDPQAAEVLNAALILCADHELNASAFAARVVASAGGTPYAVVSAGLAALQGVRHGGQTERVSDLLREVDTPERAREVIGAWLRRGDAVPGFGHRLYPQGDPRGLALLNLLRNRYPDQPVLSLIEATLQAADNLGQPPPNIDLALVALERVLSLPPGCALALFALGRTIGWVGHALEQYADPALIRPRARYVGDPPLQPGPDAS